MITTRNGVLVHTSEGCFRSKHSDCHVAGCECWCHTGKPNGLERDKGQSFSVGRRRQHHRGGMLRSREASA